MRLPTNVRPNPNQLVANDQWRDVFRSQYVTPHQGLNPRSIVGHPAQVAQASLFSMDVPYGNPAIEDGTMGTAWYAATEAREALASQTLALSGLGYGRASGTLAGNRALRVRRMPISAALGDITSQCTSAFPADLQVASMALMLGYYLDHEAKTGSSAAPNPTAALDAAFGPGVMQCASALFTEKARTCLDGMSTAEAQALVPEAKNAWAAIYMCIAIEAGNLDAAAQKRFLTATKRMFERGWWDENWEFKWKYLSGYTAWYQNPVLLAGGGIAGLIGYNLVKK